MLPTTLTRTSFARWLAVLVLVVAIPLAWLKPLDAQAEQHLKSGLGRALATYAVARTINGVVSVLQETGVSVQPAGIGMTFTPGQILDPVNDIVEQFSSIMFAVCVSIGIQLALLKISGTVLVSAALSVALLWWAFSVWRGRSLSRWEARLLVAAVVVRFAVPLVSTGSELAFQHVLATQFTKSNQAIATAVELAKVEAPKQDLTRDGDVSKDESWLERIKTLPEAARNFEWTKKLRELLDMDAKAQKAKAKYAQIMAQLDDLVGDMINVIASFAVQTVLLPLLLLWLVTQLVRQLVSPHPRSP